LNIVIIGDEHVNIPFGDIVVYLGYQ
jgi:hypothetical protein